MHMPKVTLLPNAVSARVASGETLLIGAAAAGVTLPQFCGGVAACTTCRVRVQAGARHLSPIELPEEEVLAESGILRTHRLACQARVFGDVEIEVA
jgi:ferredoxin